MSRAANALGVSRQTYANYETGARKMSPDMILKISELFHVSTDDILRGPIIYADPKVTVHSFLEIPILLPSRSVRIPVLRSISTNSSYKIEENVIGLEEIPEDMTQEGQKYFAIKIKDDTMYPEYMIGDVVIILRQPWCDPVEDCVVCSKDYEGMLATVRKNADGGMTLTYKNSRYPPQTFSQQQVLDYPVRIMGVVVEIRRKIKSVNTKREPSQENPKT